MFSLTNKLMPSVEVAERAKHTFIRKRSETQYVVTPRKYSKTRRLVTFIPGSPVRVLCEDLCSKEQCPANKFDALCYHALKAIWHIGGGAKQGREARQRDCQVNHRT